MVAGASKEEGREVYSAALEVEPRGVAKRTTVTLEDDVMGLLKNQVRLTGKTFKSVVNDALRAGLAHGSTQLSSSFTVVPKDLGARQGCEFDDIAGLIETAEGPQHR